MRLPLVLAAAVALSTATALAQQPQPRYLPTRDVTVIYQISSNRPGAPETVTAHITPSGDLRIDTPDRGSVIYNFGSERADWLLPKGGVYFEIPVGGSLAGALLPNRGARFTEMGHAVVAGLPCTEWRVTTPRGSGTACVTTDGVILRAEGGDTRGTTGAIVATNVAFGPQPADLFAPPPGAQRLSIPTKIPGLARLPQ